MTKLVVLRPFHESDLHDDRRLDPMRAQARQSFRNGERRLVDLDQIQLLTQVEQQLSIESSADLSRENEIILVVITDEQRAESDARALRIGEAADDELLRRFDLHLEPELRS